MKSESDKILSMLQEGTISAAEAEELLEAVEDSPPVSRAAGFGDPPPDMDHLRSNWRQPFNISLIIAAISGSLMWRTRRASGLGKLLRNLLLMPLVLISAISALLLYFSKDGPWFHIRLRSADGDRLALSLPFPLQLIRGGLQLAQSQVPDPEVADKLNIAAEFLEEIESSDLQDPVTIDLKDEGDSVQIYLG